MLVRVYHVDMIEDVTLGVAEGSEVGTGRTIRFVGDRGELNGVALAIKAGTPAVVDVKSSAVMAIDGEYPYLIGSEVKLPRPVVVGAACSHAVDSDCSHYS